MAPGGSFKGDCMRDEVKGQMLSGEGGEVRGSRAISQMQELLALGISTYQEGRELLP